MSKIIDQIRGFAVRNFAEHELRETLNEGLFRAYRCQKPGTWCYGFDVTFWPGWVAITGDIGHLALSREQDMIPWLRRVLKLDTIDLRYVAEKAPRCITTREWTTEAAHSMIDSILEAETERLSEGYEEQLGLHDFDERYVWETQVIPKLIDMGCHHFYEYGDAKDWTAEFIWCVLGLQWFVRAFDAANEETVIVAAAS